MTANTRMAEIFVTSKPVNFYVYSLLIMFGALGFGLILVYVKEGEFSGKIINIVLPCLGVAILSFLARFWAARNIQSLREKILATESDEEAFTLITGGVKWGLVSFAAVALTFYISIRPYL